MGESEFEDWVQPEGRLHSIQKYISYTPGDDHAILDGDFTAAELRQIAEHMEKFSK